MSDARYFRRREAAEYLKNKYGFTSPATLAKLACIGGGPEFHKVGPLVLYKPTCLDDWACAKIGAPQRSTSDRSKAA
jgi:hypothetical protein